MSLTSAAYHGDEEKQPLVVVRPTQGGTEEEEGAHHHQRRRRRAAPPHASPPLPRTASCTLAGVVCAGVASLVLVMTALGSRKPYDVSAYEYFEGGGRGTTCDGTCPAAKPRQWTTQSDTGSAHVLFLGDSTDKLWHVGFCNGMLPASSRCVHPQHCTTLTSSFLPNNMGPLVCVEGDDRCGRDSCYVNSDANNDGGGGRGGGGGGGDCWAEDNEVRAAAACKPPVPEGPSLGFVHVCGAVDKPAWTNALNGNDMARIYLRGTSETIFLFLQLLETVRLSSSWVKSSSIYAS